jgi:hypothetical protein
VGHYVGIGSHPKGRSPDLLYMQLRNVDVSNRSLVKSPANDLDRLSAAVATPPAGDVNLKGLERQRRVLSQPGIGAIAILFACFSLSLVSGVAHAYAPSRFPFLKESPPALQIVIGATGMFACLVLFLIGFAVNRLK